MIAVAGDNARAVWAGRIREAWRDSVEAVCNVAQILIEAKDAIPHGQFGAMCKAAGLRPGMAQRLMAIGRDTRIKAAQIRPNGPLLPSSWRTLYELTKLSDEQFESGLALGFIHAGTKRRDYHVGHFNRLICSAELIAIDAVRRGADPSFGWLFDRTPENPVVAFVKAEPVYNMALRQCGSWAAFREIVELARGAPQPGVIGALAEFVIFLPEMDWLVDHLVAVAGADRIDSDPAARNALAGYRAFRFAADELLNSNGSISSPREAAP